ncbi:MAG: PIN domain-containing protein [Candidatus Wallbacteria bacterium]|nr:PIN domain-containing protein [Candidatus Wallbacteria bacterium]
MPFVLDTNIVGELLREERGVVAHTRKQLRRKQALLMCPVVLYELERGLLAKPGATKKRALLAEWLDVLEYRELDRSVWMEAARLWADSRRTGRPHSDDDLLIAAFAKVHGAILVTRNRRDFEGLGVRLEGWDQSS